MTEYNVGDLARLTAAFTNVESGALVDPTTVILEYKAPTGAKVTLQYPDDPALVRDSTGKFHADISMTESGHWQYRWSSTGAGQAADQGSFLVRAKILT